ncbi:hypothetical protein X975_16430, partial [Stegodyphus mimosarum]
MASCTANLTLTNRITEFNTLRIWDLLFQRSVIVMNKIGVNTFTNHLLHLPKRYGCLVHDYKYYRLPKSAMMLYYFHFD